MSDATAPRFQLTGSALFGVEPQHMVRAMFAGIAAGAPVEVCLGAILSPDEPKALRLADFWAADRMRLTLPPETNRREKARASLSTTLANDRYGNCVVAGAGHASGVWTANDDDSGGEALMTEAEAVSQYKAICGPGDRGCYIPAVLNHWRDRGLSIGGRNRKIDGYLKVDHRNHDLVRAAVVALGGLKIGFNCPREFLSNSRWDYYGTDFVGGHDAPPVDYTPDGPLSSSWGRVYQWTWRAWDAYVTECYAVLSPDWYSSDQLAPSGFDAAALKGALAAFGRGEIPPDPVPPTPKPPTPPPAEQWPAYTLTLSNGVTGTATPVLPAVADEVEIACPDRNLGMRLLGVLGDRFGPGALDWRDGKLRARRPDRMKARDWAAFFEALTKLLIAIIPLFMVERD